jgi:adenosyl cobinamide kinase/adenosyl cobinamide phosphate guanylyltransferase
LIHCIQWFIVNNESINEERIIMTQMEALELALRLAIAAPDQERANQVVLLAEEIAAGMSPEEIATVKEELEFEGRS